MAPPPEPRKKGAPAWMVSFGDMMTLILTFFILLVSLSKEQSDGLMAKGVGSFVVALRSFGLPGILDDSAEASIFRGVRQRFNLPPEEEAERQADRHVDASDKELIRAMAERALAPHRETTQPGLASFATDSAELTPSTMRYLDMIAGSLQPGPGELLQLEGHARDAGEAFGGDDRRLAFARARAVSEYLIEERGFPRSRVAARAWVTEIAEPGPGTRCVDARLVSPDHEP
jgi:chemotaxis protein MotB